MDSTQFQFSKDGFEILPFLSPSDFLILKHFAVEVLTSLFKDYAGFEVGEEEILSYHKWGESRKVPHREILKAKNRHLNPDGRIKEILNNKVLSQFLKQIGIHKFRLWDEGLGWLAFRLIRPGPGDGYPFSCKNWGPAKNVISVWIPILGFERDLMIHLIPGSHLKEYPKYLPSETHFTKDEYRLAQSPAPEESLRPLLKPGQALLFHPKTIHAEEVEKGEYTRFNLEFRIEPL